MIDYTKPDLRDGISGGAEISGGNMTVQESKDLAFVLNTGALPVKLETAYQQQVSATLGKDSLNQGLIAGLIGLGIVLLYMLLYYRFLGLVADLALIVYGILLWGLFNAHPRDAHAARHRRHDPHHRCGRRRQRRHLRAHQGRGAPRQDRALRGQLGLRARLQDHPRRQHPHDAHGAGALPVRHGRRPRASPSRSSSACSSACSPRCCSRAPCSACWPASPSSTSRRSWASRRARSTSRRPSWATRRAAASRKRRGAAAEPGEAASGAHRRARHRRRLRRRPRQGRPGAAPRPAASARSGDSR